MGPVIVIILTLPIVIAVLYLFSKFCCCLKVMKWFSKQLDKTFFNKLIMFVDGILLLITTCAWINIY